MRDHLLSAFMATAIAEVSCDPATRIDASGVLITDSVGASSSATDIAAMVLLQFAVGEIAVRSIKLYYNANLKSATR